MQPERQISIAMLGISAAILLPVVWPALRGDFSHVTAGKLLFGNLLGAGAIFFLTLMNLPRDLPRGWRIVAGLLLGALTLLYAGGTAWIALHATARAAPVLYGLAALPFLGFGVGLYGALKN